MRTMEWTMSPATFLSLRDGSETLYGSESESTRHGGHGAQ